MKTFNGFTQSSQAENVLYWLFNCSLIGSKNHQTKSSYILSCFYFRQLDQKIRKTSSHYVQEKALNPKSDEEAVKNVFADKTKQLFPSRAVDPIIRRILEYN